MVRRHFRFRRLLLGLAFAAIVVPVAQAQPGDSGFWTERPVRSQISPRGGVTPTMSQLEAEAKQYRARLDAYANKWRARLDSYAAASGQTASSQPSIQGGVTPTTSQLQAEASRYRAKQDTAEQAGPRGSDGFNWTDAAIGAVVTFGAAALLLAAIAVARRHRSRPDRAGLAST